MMNKKQKRVLMYSVVAISILLVIAFVSVRPFSITGVMVLRPIEPDPDPDGSIVLVWNTVDVAYEYHVEMSKDGGDWESIKVVYGLSSTITGLPDGTYEFRVIACNVFGVFIAESNVESVVVCIIGELVPPNEPILEVIESPNTDGKIDLEWDVVPNALYYEVYKSVDDGDYDVIYPIIEENYYTDLVYIDGTYSYKITAKNDLGTSGFSNVESVDVCFPISDPPNEPILESIVPETSNDGVIHLSWDSVLDTVYYEVYRSIDEGLLELIKTLDENYCDDFVLENGVYSYGVKAVNDFGASGFSNMEYVVVYISEPTDEPTEPIEPTEPSDDYTMLYILLGVLVVLIVPVVILVKKKKR